MIGYSNKGLPGRFDRRIYHPEPNGQFFQSSDRPFLSAASYPESPAKRFEMEAEFANVGRIHWYRAINLAGDRVTFGGCSV